MSNLPDFAEHGYQVIRELGHNRAGGRVTYLATPLVASEGEPVVIKQFQFASSDTSWADYDSYEREIQVLRGLDCPGIPRYLDCFETAAGFCLVQEYKDALTLAEPRPWTPVQIKQVAIALLEILVYLQNRIPPIIHRDIKPENILVDGLLNVYLVDFGFAHIGEGEVSTSSVVKGTLGFMPPEQLFNRQLTPASDLYGVGATLICLLTGTKSIDIGNLIDPNYRINFQPLVSKLSQRWIKWLAKMVEPKPKDRFADAATALEALKPIEISRVPKVISSHQIVQFTAKKQGEQLTQTITIRNSVPETMLTGRWKVAPHKSDPKTTTAGHAWISFTPARFKSNEAACKITVDTSRLMAGQTYERDILLLTNSAPESYTLALKVQTAPAPREMMKLPNRLLAGLFGLALTTVWTAPVKLSDFLLSSLTSSDLGKLVWCLLLLWGVVATVQLIQNNLGAARKGAIASGVTGAISGAIALAMLATRDALEMGVYGAIAGYIIGLLVGAYAGAGTEILAERLTGYEPEEAAPHLAGGVAGAVMGVTPLVVAAGFISTWMTLWARLGVGILAGIAASGVVTKLYKRGRNRGFAVGLSVLTTAFGMSVGWVMQVGLWNPSVLLAVLSTGIPLGKMIYPYWQRSRGAANYRKSKLHLIKP